MYPFFSSNTLSSSLDRCALSYTRIAQNVVSATGSLPSTNLYSITFTILMLFFVHLLAILVQIYYRWNYMPFHCDVQHTSITFNTSKYCKICIPQIYLCNIYVLLPYMWYFYIWPDWRSIINKLCNWHKSYAILPSSSCRGLE